MSCATENPDYDSPLKSNDWYSNDTNERAKVIHNLVPFSEQFLRWSDAL